MKPADLDAFEASLTDDERRVLVRLADGIAQRRLTSAALFVLEASLPLAFVGSQAMLVIRPFVAMAWPEPARWDTVQRLFERRGAVPLLLRYLEARV